MTTKTAEKTYYYALIDVTTNSHVAVAFTDERARDSYVERLNITDNDLLTAMAVSETEVIDLASSPYDFLQGIVLGEEVPSWLEGRAYIDPFDGAARSFVIRTATSQLWS